MENENEKSRQRSVRVPIDLDMLISREAEEIGTDYSKVALKYLAKGLKGLDPVTMAKIQNILNLVDEALRTGSIAKKNQAQRGANELWKSLSF
ncbi:MAG: hypothetical protein J6P14_05310 [Ruminococcus sp.]|nr:hypothetical protein [Ruminococcus sp.]